MGAAEETTETRAGGQSPLEAGTVEESFGEEHPEVLVGAALAGGFILAQILKRLGRE
jgi:hypothetical protein